LPQRDPALEQEGEDLVDQAGAARHQPVSRSVQRLQVELGGALDRHKAHLRPLHGLGDGFGVGPESEPRASERSAGGRASPA
jgi:hypothetical protein